VSGSDAAGESRLGWYARRLRRMSPAEMTWRGRDQAVKAAWKRRQLGPDDIAAICARTAPAGERQFSSVLPDGIAAAVPVVAGKAVIEAADQLMAGDWEVLGVTRTDLLQPDWFRDPVTGRSSDPRQYAFSINHRSQEQTGNIKQVWELSRLQHLTLLATAWFLTQDDRYARRVADQLRSWWRKNPFLSGVHWTSGIEIGIRLISLAWIRRLLDDWADVSDLFEADPLAVAQIRWHQQYLAAFRSRGSSANNHVIAEAAGQLTASCAFPWFPESERWRRAALALLERELIHNTFPSGIDRELATDYQSFVAALGLLASVEANAAGHPVPDAVWERLAAMTDSGAALLDVTLRPPRQGDGDDGRAILFDAPADNQWPMLLSLGDAVFGRLDWWPALPAPDITGVLVGALAGSRREVPGRPPERPSRFQDAGITILRATPAGSQEIWCRCDGGPHGFLSIAAHAHADALSVELRYGGVEILADPGTYCYHGEPEWRSYFRSTIAHNTAEVAGQSQSLEGGPFMWLRHARSWEISVNNPDLNWTAEHDGYSSLDRKARHRRSLHLDPVARALSITDVIDAAGHEVRLAFHFGPLVQVSLDGARAVMAWPEASAPGQALMELPTGLEWSLHRGETDPILGWYSPGLGRRQPAATLVGTGRPRRDLLMITRLAFTDDAQSAGADSDEAAEIPAMPGKSEHTVSWVHVRHRST
jgi:Heparinase II/III-like protein/Heparinase II/III N-terminus